MKLTLTLDRESDGRWIAAIEEMPGVLAYGQSREEAKKAVKSLAIDVFMGKLDEVTETD
jgi:predicted RNase H-like HicB family nuclease